MVDELLITRPQLTWTRVALDLCVELIAPRLVYWMDYCIALCSYLQQILLVGKSSIYGPYRARLLNIRPYLINTLLHVRFCQKNSKAKYSYSIYIWYHVMIIPYRCNTLLKYNTDGVFGHLKPKPELKTRTCPEHDSGENL